MFGLVWPAIHKARRPCSKSANQPGTEFMNVMNVMLRWMQRAPSWSPAAVEASKEPTVTNNAIFQRCFSYCGGSPFGSGDVVYVGCIQLSLYPLETTTTQSPGVSRKFLWMWWMAAFRLRLSVVFGGLSAGTLSPILSPCIVFYSVCFGSFIMTQLRCSKWTSGHDFHQCLCWNTMYSRDLVPVSVITWDGISFAWKRNHSMLIIVMNSGK